MRTTFAFLGTNGNVSVMKERLNKSDNCFEISFLRGNDILYIRHTIWAISFIGVKRGHDVSYFFFTRRLQKYCTIAPILKMKNVCVNILCCFW